MHHSHASRPSSTGQLRHVCSFKKSMTGHQGLRIVRKSGYYVGRGCTSRASRRNLLLGTVAAGGGSSRESWDIGRFAKTVLYFNPPPSIQDILSPIFGQVDKKSGARDSAGQWILVTGATGGVGSRVVKKLLAKGRKVRAVARDAGKAKSMLIGLSKKQLPPVAVCMLTGEQVASPRLFGGFERGQGAALDIVAADITEGETLNSRIVEGCSAVISATAAIVSPKEGDTPDREKYKQLKDIGGSWCLSCKDLINYLSPTSEKESVVFKGGVKFYAPEVSGASPEAVEYRGINNLVEAVRPSLQRKADSVQVFDASQKDMNVEWGPLDDVVMGGVSESSFARMQSGSEAVFSGRVSSANNGGFASVRTRNFDPALDMSSCDALRLRVKGDGLRYKVTLRTDTNWDGIGYTQSFDTEEGKWQDIDLPFQHFIPIFRAKTKPDAPPLNRASITSVQLMLSKFEYDGALNPNFRVGEFSLPLASIYGVKSDGQGGQAARLVHVSSAGVTRVNRPNIDLEKEPPAVRMNEELGGLLTWKLAGEGVIRNSGLPFAIVRPVALTEEPAGADLEIAQGDNVKGKISREEIASLCIALLEEPAALDTTFEIRSTVPFSEPYTGSNSSSTAQERDWGSLLREAKLDPKVTGEAGTEASRRENAALTSAAI